LLKEVRRSWFIKFLKEQKVYVLFILFLLVIVYIAFKLLIFPEIEKVLACRKDLAVINEKIYDLQKALLEHPNLENEIEVLRGRHKKIMKDFPSEREFLSLTHDILKGLEDEGIKIINFKYLYEIKDEIGNEAFKKYGLELEILSDYFKFGKFLEKMESKGLRFTIDKIHIIKVSQTELNINMRIIFILKAEG
jgi:Tfp pilus assembly protein PilO